MISDFAAQTRPLGAISVPAPRPVTLSAHRAAGTPFLLSDVWLRPGDLIDVSDALGAQQFCVVDGEVTFTARREDRVRRWRGHLDAQGLVEL